MSGWYRNMNSKYDIRCYQIYYRLEQKEYLENGMIPYDNTANPYPEWCEYWIFRDLWKQRDRYFGEKTGFFSWKYKEKINLSYNQIENFVKTHYDADCCIFSPAVFQVAFYKNVWQQGEVWHPGITAMAQEILDSVGYRIDLQNTVDHHLSSAFCNFWVASIKFWEKYIEFMEPIYNFIEEQKNNSNSKFWQKKFGSAGGNGFIQELPVIPYLVERFFSVFVKLNRNFKIVAWEYPLNDLLNRANETAYLIPLANWAKLAYERTGNDYYLRLFNNIQMQMYITIQQIFENDPNAVIS